MSNYRDDTTEILVVKDTAWGGQKSMTEDMVRVTDEVFHRIRVFHTETVRVTDEAFGFPGSMLSETLHVTDQVFDHLHAADLLVESIKVADTTTGKLRVMHSETLHVTDEVLERVAQMVTETLRVTDQAFGTRRATVMVEETLKVTDQAFQASRVMVVESLAIADTLFGAKRAHSMVSESLRVTDEPFDARAGAAQMITETIRLFDETFGTNHAAQMVVETLEVTDQLFGDDITSQAWTANLRTWAMSRYDPYTFTSVAVIDGVAYATGPDGVYALDGADEQIAAKITTGKIDVGQGGLVHPLWAFMEYELDGTAELDVTTTQSGVAPETYTYVLPAEPAAVQTNGRFTFGRGLRGRHFSFTLRLNAKRGFIDDLSVETAQTKRRV